MSSNVPGSSNDDNPEEEKPFVSRYGMKDAKDINGGSVADLTNYEYAVMCREKTFNFKAEPVEDRERRFRETTSIFMKRCRDPNEICAYTYYCEPPEEDLHTYYCEPPEEDLQPEEMYSGIKTEPIDEVEENIQESSLYMETEPFDYLPVVYSENSTTENAYQMNAFNPKENDLDYNRTQLSREPEEEIDQQVNIPIIVPLEINETNMELVVPEAIVSTPSSSDTNIIENPASVQRRKRKKKDVISTPTRVSTRIKKPRIMFNI